MEQTTTAPKSETPVAIIYTPTQIPSPKQREWEQSNQDGYQIHHVTDDYPKSHSQQKGLRMILDYIPKGPLGKKMDCLVLDQLEHLCLGGIEGLVSNLSILIEGNIELCLVGESEYHPFDIEVPFWFLRRLMLYPKTVALRS